MNGTEYGHQLRCFEFGICHEIYNSKTGIPSMGWL